MKLIQTTKKSTRWCKALFKKSYPRGFPFNMGWVRSTKGKQIIWNLYEGGAENPIARVVNLGDTRKIYIDPSRFEVSGKRGNPGKTKKCPQCKGTGRSSSVFTKSGVAKGCGFCGGSGKVPIKSATSKAKPAARRNARRQVPPPFKKLTRAKIDKLKKLFRVHDPRANPALSGDVCPVCGLVYDNLKTGLDFQAVKDMLWIQDDNPEYWRHKRRGSVLGLWNEIKAGMWADHLAMCEQGEQMSEKEYLNYLDTLEPLDEY